MNELRFDFLARRLRSKEPALTAAKLVLVDGLRAAEAAKISGVFVSSLSRTLKSFRELDEEIIKLYGDKEIDSAR